MEEERSKSNIYFDLDFFGMFEFPFEKLIHNKRKIEFMRKNKEIFKFVH